MKKLSKAGLIPAAGHLLNQGYKKLFATTDGQFFTEEDLAKAHAHRIDDLVYQFDADCMNNQTGDIDIEPKADIDKSPVETNIEPKVDVDKSPVDLDIKPGIPVSVGSKPKRKNNSKKK